MNQVYCCYLLLCVIFCAPAYCRNVSLVFTPAYFDTNENVLVSCKPDDPLDWHKVSQLTFYKTSPTVVSYTMTRNCITNATTVAGSDERVNTTSSDFQLQWVQLNSSDEGEYFCTFAECNDTTSTSHNSTVATKLTFVDLVNPTLLAPANNTLLTYYKNSVDVVCQVNKTVLKDGDQLLIQHIFNGLVINSVTNTNTSEPENTAANTNIKATYSFTPNDDTKRAKNDFTCSNVNKHKPGLNKTVHVLTVHVEYPTTQLRFNSIGADSNTVSGGEAGSESEFKVDLTSTTLKVQCLADGYPAPTYRVRQMSGPSDAVIIENNVIDIAYESMSSTSSHLRFRCDAETVSSLGQSNSSRTGYLNVYTSSSYRNEPTIFALLLSVFLYVRRITN